jgi:coenzyme F420-reducing hydrogenase beta subunit/polysaccharide pyruvyl transferase WcaK-like protein
MNVTRTRELDLCVSCEICHAICPVEAVSMEYESGQFLPYIDEERCIDCGDCLALCPGIDIDPFDIRNQTVTDVMFDGPYLDTYTAYSNDLQIRAKSTSGGVITQLILELIKNKEFDAAFVLQFDKFENRPARVSSTNQTEAIMNSMGSKYIPASVFDVVYALKDNPEGKYIIVGTPCQFQGIRNYLKYLKQSSNNLLFLGLFCDKTLNFNILGFFDDNFKKPEEHTSRFIFRSKEKYGWPGDVQMSFDSGRELVIDKSIRMNLKPFFQLNRCLFCLDKSNVAADISCGDCYISGTSDSSGKSSVVIRTDKGQKVFDKYSYLFNLEPATMEEISASQQLFNRQDNLEYAKYLIKTESIYPDTPPVGKISDDIPKRLTRLQKHIRWGKQYKKSWIKYTLLIQRVKSMVFYAGQAIAAGMALGEYLLFTSFRKSKIDAATKAKRNIVIVGGALSNKGSQAMTFTVVDQMKRRFPDKDIYLFSTPDFRRPEREKRKYTFKFRSWDIFTAFRLSGFLGRLLVSKSNEWQEEKDTEKIIRNACCFIDISGFALSSELGFVTSWYYLLNIMTAKKFSVPFYILPQSIGPFDYPLTYRFLFSPMVKMFLKYPERIYPREEAGVNSLMKYIKRKVEKYPDIVLQNDSYEISHIFNGDLELKGTEVKTNSVGIIPNLRVIERTDAVELMKVYNTLINSLISAKKTVYVVRHSHEDLGICTDIKNRFHDNDKVILVSHDLNAFQLENIIKQFDFIVASRYHSIVHAYRNVVPSLVIGWSNKYRELLKDFNQLGYYFDCRIPIDAAKINIQLEKLINNRQQEISVIKSRLAQIKKMNVFNVFDEYRSE